MQPGGGRHHDRSDRNQKLHEVDDEAVGDGEVGNRADVHVRTDHDGVGLKREPGAGVQHQDVEAEREDRARHPPVEVRQPHARRRVLAPHQ